LWCDQELRHLALYRCIVEWLSLVEDIPIHIFILFIRRFTRCRRTMKAVMTRMQQYRITGCAVVYDHEHRILLKKDPVRGWELPGGHIASHEPIPDAVVREVKEETGIDIEILKFCGISQDVKDHICHTFWNARATGGQLTTCEESLEVGYFNVNDALNTIHRQDFSRGAVQVSG